MTPFLKKLLWGYVKAQVYAEKPQTFERLEASIRQAIANNVARSDEQSEPSCASVCWKPWWTFEQYFVQNISVISKLQNKAQFTVVFNLKLLY